MFHVAIPRRVPRRFPRHDGGAITRSSSSCRNPPKGPSPISTSIRWVFPTTISVVAIPRRVPRRFPQSTRRSPMIFMTAMSQSPEGSLADFHRTPVECIMVRRRPSQSPEGSLADFHADPRDVLASEELRVAIPRRVPRRFPLRSCIPDGDQRHEMSQSPEGSLADFHAIGCRVPGELRNVAIPRRVPRRFPPLDAMHRRLSTCSVAIPRRVPRRFPPRKEVVTKPSSKHVAIPRRVPRRFPLEPEVRIKQVWTSSNVAIPRRVPRRFPHEDRTTAGGRC